MRRSPTLRRKGGSHDLYRTIGTRRPIRRRGDVLPRPAVRIFGRNDCRQTLAFPLGLAPDADFQARVREVPPRRTAPATDRRRTVAPEILRGAGGLGGHP